MAKVTKVRDALQELKDYANSLAPQKGFFSTLDKVVEEAPFPQNSVAEWRNFLKPGRMYKAQDMQFPIKQEELDYVLRHLPETGNMTREEMLEFMRRERPSFGLRINDSEVSADGLSDEGIERVTDNYLPSVNLTEQVADPSLPQDVRRLKLGRPQYGPDGGDEYRRLSHQSADYTYQESVTKLQNLDHDRQHFGRDALSHSRTTSHVLPDGRKIRLVEEIQSDVHKDARKPRTLERHQLDRYATPEQREALDTLRDTQRELERDIENGTYTMGRQTEINQEIRSIENEIRESAPERGYITDEESLELEDLRARHAEMNANVFKTLTKEEYQAYRQAYVDMETASSRMARAEAVGDKPAHDEAMELWDRADDTIARLERDAQDRWGWTKETDLKFQQMLEKEAGRPVPDAPFKGPKDYGRLELRKQLVSAVNNGESHLALTTGQQQVDRYSQIGETSEGMAFTYDNLYRGELEKLAKQYGSKVVDIELPLASELDTRPRVMRDAMAEDLDEFMEAVVEAGDIDDYDSLNRFVDDLTGINGAERDALEEAVEQFADVMEGRTGRYGVFNAEEMQVHDMLLARMEKAYEKHARYQQLKTRMEGGEKRTFPAMEITDDVRRRVKEIGVPLWSVGAGAAGLGLLGDGEEEPAQYAKGGKVSKELAQLRAMSDRVLRGATNEERRSLINWTDGEMLSPRQLETIDAILDDTRMPGMTVYRGDRDFDTRMERPLPISTSVDPKSAKGFTHPDVPSMLEIAVPEGSQGLYLGDLTGNSFATEDEVLLPRRDRAFDFVRRIDNNKLDQVLQALDVLMQAERNAVNSGADDVAARYRREYQDLMDRHNAEDFDRPGRPDFMYQYRPDRKAEGGLMDLDDIEAMTHHAPEEWRDPQLLKRLSTALKEQWKSIDPITGETVPFWEALQPSGFEPSGFDELAAYDVPNRQRFEEGEFGTPVPGIVSDTMSTPTMGYDIAEILGYDGPTPGRDAMNEAARASEKLHDMELAAAGLDPAQGFMENTAEALGTMLGQLPMPMRALKTAGSKLGKLGKKVLGSPLEFFSPIVDPKASNYAAGALFGGAFNEYGPGVIESGLRMAGKLPPKQQEEIAELPEDMQLEILVKLAEMEQDERLGLAQGGMVGGTLARARTPRMVQRPRNGVLDQARHSLNRSRRSMPNSRRTI